MYIKNENIVERTIMPSYFLVDITKCYNNEYENMFITDEIGIEMWRAISDGDTFEKILKKFLEKVIDDKSDNLQEIVRSDLKEFMGVLKNQGYIYEV